MKQIKCRLTRVTIWTLILFIFLSPLKAQALETDFTLSAKAAIAVDANSGKILYTQNSDEVLAIASITKLLSVYLVYEEIESGNLSWDERLPISDYQRNLSQDPDLSNIPIAEDMPYTVGDAVTASLISSANSLTSALAEHIAGTEVAFVDMMQDKLSEWGIEDALLVSASGLSNEYIQGDYYSNTKEDDENMMSAQDVAIIAQHLVTDYPEILEITSQPSAVLFEGTDQEFTIWNSNNMLPGYPYETPGVIGLKTGTSPLAEACFTGFVEKNGTQIITVVLGVDEEHDRFEETGALIDYLDDTWTYQTVIKKGESPSVASIETKNSKYKTVPLMVTKNVSIWVRSSDEVELTFKETSDQITKKGKLAAPVSKSSIIGEQFATNKSDTLGYLDETIKKEDGVPVSLTKELEKDNIFSIFWYRLTS